MADRPLEIPPPVTSWILFDSDIPEHRARQAKSLSRLGVRPVVTVIEGEAVATGSTGEPTIPGYCARHGLWMSPCLWCAKPELVAADRELLESCELVDGRPW